ncbi:ATP-binding protein [Leptogranulimonas caecicola]|uniref:AAA family ATPase n=1 Tax=Leptogranulimonas caecicola TaxID=2894156 RepID=UPI003510E9E3
MLRDFSFANFRSFRDEQYFSMTRTKAAMKRQTTKWPISDISCIASVYGSNASGKTAFCNALPYLALFIERGFSQEHPLSLFKPFLLNSHSKTNPMSFLVDFSISGNRYRYEIDLTAGSVSFESLRRYNGPTNRTQRVFERALKEDRSFKFLYGKNFKGQKRAAEAMTRNDVAYLSVLHKTNCKSVEEAYSFFSDQVVFLDALFYERELDQIAERLSDDAWYANALSTIVSQADLGISVMETKGFFDAIRSRDGEAFDGFAKGVAGITGPNATAAEREKRTQEICELLTQPVKELVFTHRGADGYTAEFSRDDESNGTLSMLAFFSIALKLLAVPTVAFVDEIDTSLHPTYVEELVRLYKDPATNPCQSQLIFTTHDVSLITKSGADEPVIDPDQIWFVEKTSEGASELFPATSLNPRWEENFGRNYLHGVYGAIPRPDFHSAFARALQCEDTRQ